MSTSTLLRPLSFGEILDGAFSILRRHFLALFAAAIGPVLVMGLAYSLWLASVRASAGASSFVAGAGPAMILVGLLAGLAMVFAAAALTHYSAEVVLGNSATIGAAYRRGLRALVPILLASLLAALVGFIVMLALILIALLPTLLLSLLGEAGSAVGVAVGVALALILGALLFATLFAIVPAVVVEGAGPWGALRRSWELSRGARWRILGVLFVTWLITSLPSAGIMMAAGLGEALYDPEALTTMSGLEIAFQQVVSWLVAAVTTPFFVSVLVLLYFDRRVRLEGYDLELAAERLVPGPTAPGPAAPGPAA